MAEMGSQPDRIYNLRRPTNSRSPRVRSYRDITQMRGNRSVGQRVEMNQSSWSSCGSFLANRCLCRWTSNLLRYLRISGDPSLLETVTGPKESRPVPCEFRITSRDLLRSNGPPFGDRIHRPIVCHNHKGARAELNELSVWQCPTPQP